MTLSRGTVARYAVGSVGTGGFGTLPGLVLVYYLTDTLGVAALMAGLIVTAAKVWDVVIDPVIGAVSDREQARHGSRRRLMAAGGLLLPIFFVLTFAVPATWGPAAAGAWVLLAFVCAATAFSLFQVPYIALPAELTDSYEERTRLLTARVVVLTVAILAFGGGAPALRSVVPDEHAGYLLMAAAAGLVLGASLLVAAGVQRTGRRRRSRPGPSAAAASAAPPVATASGPSSSGAWRRLPAAYRDAVALLRTSLPFRTLLATFVLQALATGTMLAGAQYVARWVLGDEGAVTFLFAALVAPAVVFAPVWGAVAHRVGKERAFRMASGVFTVAALGLLGLAWSPGAWVYAVVAVAGAAYAGLQSLPMAMLPDVVAHDARSRGPGRAGTFSGVWTAGETTGFALGSTVLSLTLAVTGYVESRAGVVVVQPDAAVLGIVLAFSVLPAVLVAASLAALHRYPLRKEDVDAARSAATHEEHA
ncbi:MFS transporter [Isoptericola halotolerans]|uniref:Na+/melibiose symporter-like transporter n=1 Tax=Isoptericola halotolerans TaxID=300560 RepID=A0ABX2A8C1_9MICO|nr:MFS transporter [Isoptericola halotolerans]NOV98889.1 Na+/melibiose symporter-like transporter [Isoptericola halotolerans]